ncbi:MAG: hypothetical protein ABMA25_13725, partial [Ilumatobacteraceae bacterium]
MKVDSAREVAAIEPPAATTSAVRLVVGHANDPYEAAADRAADEVIARLSQVPAGPSSTDIANRSTVRETGVEPHSVNDVSVVN